MKSRFLADESVQFATIEELRKNNFDILSILESCRGISDPEVVRIANQEDRVIITEDKDFGELTFRFQKSSHGIILIRLADLPASYRPFIVLDALNKIENEFRIALLLSLQKEFESKNWLTFPK